MNTIKSPVEIKKFQFRAYFILIFMPILLGISVTLLFTFSFIFNFDVSNSLLYTSVGFTQLIGLLLVLIFLTKEGENLSSIGWTKKGVIEMILIGIGAFVILRFWEVGIDRLVLKNLPGAPGSGTSPTETLFGKLYYSFWGFPFGAFIEETIWRGYVITRLEKVHGKVWIAVVVSSIFFGLLHYGMGLRGIIGAGSIGFWLSILYIWKRNLLPCTIAHALINMNHYLKIIPFI